MKQYLVTAEEMKRYDANTMKKLQMPGLLLMERAALVTVEELQRLWGSAPCRVLVLSGRGNNGGDGLAVGRLLMLQGYEVTFVMPEVSSGSYDRCTEETRRQTAILSAYQAQIFSTIPDREYDIVIDAAFGVGLSRPVEGIWQEVVSWINHSNAFVCSVDIPSGIHADTGAVMGCAVEADLTVTYGFRKAGHILYPGAAYSGKVVCGQMGIDERSFFGERPFWYTYIGKEYGLLPERRADGNKGTFGKALLIAGSREIAGAAMLAAKSAFRAGAGMVKVITAQENRAAMQQYVPEAMLLTYTEDMPVSEAFLSAMREAEEWADCMMIGPGIGTGAAAAKLMQFAILESRLPLIIDADGLNILAQDPALQTAMAEREDRDRIMILTPHLGEFARLYGCSVAQGKEHLTKYPRQLAARLHCVIVCKDARTVVVQDKAQQGYLNTTGNAGMATAGSGDVLAGMITGLVAQGMEGMEAAVAGVYLHGYAGDLAAAQETGRAMMATDIIGCVRDAVAQIENSARKENSEAV